MIRVRPSAVVLSITGRAPHLPALDGLRGAAVLAVLLFHAGALPAGFLGVDLFFALSGYLITDLLLREVGTTGAVSPGAFWGRRVRRLLPALVVLLAAVTLLVRAVGSPEVVRTTLADGPWVQLNALNWHLVAGSAGYWDRFAADRVFEHLWSVAVEEQFYLVWPVVVLVVARCGRAGAVHGRVAVLAVLGSLASLALAVALVDAADPTRVHIGTDTRASALLLGAATATHPVRALLARAAGRRAGAAAAVLVLGIGAAWCLAAGADPVLLFTGGLFAHSLAAALLIGLLAGPCAATPRALAVRALSWRPLRWFGRVSYALYLWHWPVFVLLDAHDGGLRAVAAGALSIGLAALSTHLVEDPIRFRARWARDRRGVLVAAAAMLALAVLWAALPAPAPPAVDVDQLG